MHQNQNLFLRTVFKYSFLFVPSSVIAAVCFVLSQREVAATLETFSVFNILAAAAILYIVLSSNESRSFSQNSLKGPIKAPVPSAWPAPIKITLFLPFTT